MSLSMWNVAFKFSLFSKVLVLFLHRKLAIPHWTFTAHWIFVTFVKGQFNLFKMKPFLVEKDHQ